MKKAEVEKELKKLNGEFAKLSLLQKEIKKQRDYLIVFYEHCVAIVNEWENQPEDQRCFLLRKNFILILDYIFKYMTKNFQQGIDVDEIIYKTFMEGWLEILKNEQEKLKKELVEEQKEKSAKTPSYYS